MQGRHEPCEMSFKPLDSQMNIENDLAGPRSFRIDIIEEMYKNPILLVIVMQCILHIQGNTV